MVKAINDGIFESDTIYIQHSKSRNDFNTILICSRYDSERDIFAFANFNPEEVIPDGMDIFQETNSRFRTILDNEKLLNRFLNDEELGQAQNDKNEASEDDDDDDFDDNDPETSFLRISSHLRQALKKHLPWVRDHFKILIDFSA